MTDLLLRRVDCELSQRHRVQYQASPFYTTSALEAETFRHNLLSAVDLVEKGLVWELGVQLKGLR